MNSISEEVLRRLGPEITSLQGINGLPPEIKESIYASLVPSDLFTAYGADPLSLSDRDGNKAFKFVYPPDKGIVKIEFRRSIHENDPIVFIQLSDTIYGQVSFEWAIINDPDSERFNIHKTDNSQFLPPGSEFRNLSEEARAMEAGLAPGQVRRGLHKFHEITDLIESLLSRLHIHLILGSPYAYHNAIDLERIGYFYTSGREMMLEIDRKFQPGGNLFMKLDGSTPFRRPGMDRTIRGRSWAIHDGIMDRSWICPTMTKIVGRRFKNFTLHDAIYLPSGC